MDECLTLQHPRWDEFMERLETALLILQDPDNGEISWICPCDPSFPLSAGILDLMSGVDVDATLNYLSAHETCDCEIWLNMIANP